MESLQSKNSDIYFESFSLSNLKGDGSVMIDYYQLSKNIFDLLNEIRINPKESSKEYKEIKPELKVMEISKKEIIFSRVCKYIFYCESESNDEKK